MTRLAEHLRTHRPRLIAIGLSVLVLVVIARAVFARPGNGQDVAVDTTGASAEAGLSSDRSTPVASGGQPAAASTTSAARTPGATPTPSGPTPTPVVVQIQNTSLSTKPLVLLNPSTVRQGSSVGVTGSGFDPGTTVDVFVKQQEADDVDPLTFVQVDKSGGFGGVTFAVPESLPRGTFIVEARERKSDNVARGTAIVAGGAPQVKLGTQAAKAGDIVQLSAAGFGPDEDINVYFNDLSTDVIGTVHSDPAGGVRQGSVRVPFGAVGNNALIFVGDKSQSPVTVPFQMLNLYPSVELSSYAIKPDNVLSFSGKDFGPDELVNVHLNNPDGPPIATLQADETGGFARAGGFFVPFGLRGSQTLIFVGQQSKAPTTASFDTLPYTPSAQPSTYGGRPGTTLTFYAIGFARNEVVHALVGKTNDNPGQEVSCFRSDPLGNVAAGGSFVVPADAQSGQMIFTLVGSKSQASATAALEVIASDVAVRVPPQAPFQCDLSDGPDGPQALEFVQGPPAPASALGPSDEASAPAAAKPNATAGSAQPKGDHATRQAEPAPAAGETSQTPAAGQPKAKSASQPNATAAASQPDATPAAGQPTAAPTATEAKATEPQPTEPKATAAATQASPAAPKASPTPKPTQKHAKPTATPAAKP